MELVFLLIAFFASVVGSICGVGGGVFMKPLMDMLGLTTVAAASFLSGSTVLAMTCYNTFSNLRSKSSAIDVKTSLPLALGAAFGGVLGKYVFDLIMKTLPRPSIVGMIQAVCLALISLGTVLYTLKKASIKTLHVRRLSVCLVIGLLLGIISSFLGIGGGPNNIVVLLFFFSMDSKTAAQNSLFVILFSQLFSLIYTLCAGTVPEFSSAVLVLMCLGGIVGGAVGRRVSRRLDNALVDRLFIVLLLVIVLISGYNFFKYMG